MIGAGAGAGGFGAAAGLIDPTLLVSGFLAPKVSAMAYYNTPTYQKLRQAGRVAKETGKKGGAATGAETSDFLE